jgi:alpha-mannosidase
MLYTVMAADEITVRSSGPLFGELAVRGRLLERDGTCVARYEQVLRAQRGSRVLEIDLSLDPERLPSGDPWTTYYAARFAWSDATADLFSGIGTVTVKNDSPQLEAPHFVDVRCEKINTTILTGGLAYHRRFGLRKLDTLLIVAGETQRRFRLGVGVDVAYPYGAASEFLAPDTILANVGVAPGPRSGWFFHLNARNVVATWWEPVFDEERLRGVRVRLAETEDRTADLIVRCFRPIATARRTDFLGQQVEDLPVQDDRVSVPIKGHEWTQIEIDFA